MFELENFKYLAKEAARLKVKNEYEDEDLRLWREYKAGNQQAKWELLKRFKGLIAQAAMTSSNVLPRPVVEAKLKQYALQAIDKYNPSNEKGAKLSTFVRDYFKQINRQNYENQQAIRLPENIMMRYGRFQNAHNELSSALGRDPTARELAEHLGWSENIVATARERFHKELVESKQVFDPAVTSQDVAESAMRYVYFNATEPERYLMERKMGYLGKPVAKSVDDIRKELKLTPYQFNELQRKLITKLDEAKQVKEREV